MKVLQINCVFQKGSTGRITNDLHAYYRSVGIDSYVIYGRGQKPSGEGVYKIASEIGSRARNLASRVTGNLYGMGRCGLRRAISRIEKIRPDIVHLQCINGYFIDIYGLLEYLKEHRIPTLLTLHAEFMYTGNCGYAFDCDGWKTGCRRCPDVRAAIASRNARAPEKNWQKMKAAFDGFEGLRLVGVSDWVSQRAKLSPILSEKEIVTVLNGVDDTVFCRQEAAVERIQEIHDRGRRAVLFVTPYFEDENKGGAWLLRLAKAMADQPVEFIVIGRSDAVYPSENLHFIGELKDPRELAKWYSAADLTLLLSKRETFSMICAESLCCGTPIVGFCAGAPELIALGQYSRFVPYGDLPALVAEINAWLEQDLDREGISRAARRAYSKQAMADNYIGEYQKILGTKQTNGKD